MQIYLVIFDEKAASLKGISHLAPSPRKVYFPSSRNSLEENLEFLISKCFALFIFDPVSAKTD